MTKHTADPAARTVFDQRTFSAVNGETLGGIECIGTTSVTLRVGGGGGGLLRVNVPINEWMSLIGASAVCAQHRQSYV